MRTSASICNYSRFNCFNIYALFDAYFRVRPMGMDVEIESIFQNT